MIVKYRANSGFFSFRRDKGGVHSEDSNGYYFARINENGLDKR